MAQIVDKNTLKTMTFKSLRKQAKSLRKAGYTVAPYTTLTSDNASLLIKIILKAQKGGLAEVSCSGVQYETHCMKKYSAADVKAMADECGVDTNVYTTKAMQCTQIVKSPSTGAVKEAPSIIAKVRAKAASSIEDSTAYKKLDKIPKRSKDGSSNLLTKAARLGISYVHQDGKSMKLKKASKDTIIKAIIKAKIEKKFGKTAVSPKINYATLVARADELGITKAIPTDVDDLQEYVEAAEKDKRCDPKNQKMCDGELVCDASNRPGVCISPKLAASRVEDDSRIDFADLDGVRIIGTHKAISKLKKQHSATPADVKALKKQTKMNSVMDSVVAIRASADPSVLAAKISQLPDSFSAEGLRRKKLIKKASLITGLERSMYASWTAQELEDEIYGREVVDNMTIAKSAEADRADREEARRILISQLVAVTGQPRSNYANWDLNAVIQRIDALDYQVGIDVNPATDEDWKEGRDQLARQLAEVTGSPVSTYDSWTLDQIVERLDAADAEDELDYEEQDREVAAEIMAMQLSEATGNPISEYKDWTVSQLIQRINSIGVNKSYTKQEIAEMNRRHIEDAQEEEDSFKKTVKQKAAANELSATKAQEESDSDISSSDDDEDDPEDNGPVPDMKVVDYTELLPNVIKGTKSADLSEMSTVVFNCLGYIST